MSEEERLPERLARIQAEWGMSDSQMAALCHLSVEEYSRHLLSARRPALPEEGTVPRGMENSVPVVGIYRRLRERFPSAEEQVKWLFTGHADFGGNKPIDVAASSVGNLFWVSYYLESSRPS